MLRSQTQAPAVVNNPANKLCSLSPRASPDPEINPMYTPTMRDSLGPTSSDDLGRCPQRHILPTGLCRGHDRNLPFRIVCYGGPSPMQGHDVSPRLMETTTVIGPGGRFRSSSVMFTASI